MSAHVNVQIVEALPGPILSLAAFCREDFGALVRRLRVTLEVSPIQSFGETIDLDRRVYLRLPTGRFGALSKRDSQSEFEIALQRVGRVFYERELTLVLEFAGIVDPTGVERYCNPPFRFAADPPSERDLKYWGRLVGSAYPYAVTSGP